MNSSQQPPTTISKVSVLIFLVLLALFLVGFAASFYTNNQQTKLLKEANASAKQAKSSFEDTAANVAKEKQAIDQAFVLSNRSEWVRFKEVITSCTEQIEKAKAENDKRLQVESNLLDSPQGAAISQNPTHLAIFSAIREKHASSLTVIRDWQVSIAAYQASIDQMLAIDKPMSQVPEESFLKVVKLRDEATSLARDLEMANRQIDSFVKQIGDLPTSEETLRETIKNREAELYAKMLAVRQKDKELIAAQEEEKTRQILKKQEAERLALEREKQAEVHKAEMAAIAAKAEADISAAKAKEDQLRREKIFFDEDEAMKADIVAINSMLMPFISKAKNQLKSTGHMVLSEESVAISLSALEGYGALNPTEDGVKKLKAAASHVTDKEIRPLGGFSIDLFDLTKPQEAQALLRKHAKAMVRAKLLAP